MSQTEKKNKEAMTKLVETYPSCKLEEPLIESSGLFSKVFRWHGSCCASRPWEVIFMTLTLIVSSLSLTFLQQRKDSFDEYSSMRTQNSDTMDRVILTIARCVALLYTYLQFNRLRRLECKYLLAIASIFTIIFSFGFSMAVITLFDTAFKELNEALPFFFLFIDIPKACTLAKFALSSNDRTEIACNIGEGMGTLAPSLSLDTLTMGLLMGVGMWTDVNIISSIACFSCLSIIANYLAFIFFYPACLAILLELIRDKREMIGVYQLARARQDANHKPNLALHKVKLIMSSVLFLFHAHHLRVVSSSSSSSSPSLPPSNMVNLNQQSDPKDWYAKDLQLDTVITAVLASFLIIKYIFIDNTQTSHKKNKGILKSIKSVSFMNDFISSQVLPSISPNIPNIPHTLTPHEGNMYAEVDSLVDGQQTECKRGEVGGDNVIAGDSEMVVMAGDGERVVMAGEKRGESGWVGERLCEEGGVLEKFFKEKSNENEDVHDTDKTKTKRGGMFSIGGDDDDGGGDDDDDDQSKMHTPSIHSSMKSQPHEQLISLELLSHVDEEAIRSVDECVEILNDERGPIKLTDQEVMQLVTSKKLPAYRLETVLDDFQRGVSIRRKLISGQLFKKDSILNLPYINYDYKYVHGACCENVIGYLPIPVGVAGPLLVDGVKYHVPMATTEGCLVASANRGCRALATGGGVKSSLLDDGMTRAPLVRFSSAMRASEAKRWFEGNFELLADAFNSTSRFARLKSLRVKQNSRNLYIRFVAITGDAMGMNMLSKGSEKALMLVQEKHFTDMKILSLSSNFCTDKKPNAINWIDGRGKSIVCEAVVPGKVVREVLKTTVAALVDLNIHKNLVGSTLAGSVGGSNAHAANIVTAIFIATGQDPAQNVCSSNCMTIMEPYLDEDRENGLRDWARDGDRGEKQENDGEDKKEVDLYISCNMPSLEVGTIGGGTILPPQAACLEMLGVKGAHRERPGENACNLARVICSTVMAGELSLMASLTAGDLVKSHLKHNRSSLNMALPPQCIPI